MKYFQNKIVFNKNQVENTDLVLEVLKYAACYLSIYSAVFYVIFDGPYSQVEFW